MEIKPKFQFVEGSFDTQRVKLLCIPDDNHGRVDGMNAKPKNKAI